MHGHCLTGPRHMAVSYDTSVSPRHRAPGAEAVCSLVLRYVVCGTCSAAAMGNDRTNFSDKHTHQALGPQKETREAND